MFFRRRIFSRPSGTVNRIDGELPHHEGLVAQLAEFGFDVALHHPHGRHHDDDGEHADQDAQQRQGGAQLVRGHGAHGHAEALAEFGQQDGYAFGEHADFTRSSSASTGFIRAARQAGTKPDTTPVTSETSSARLTTIGDSARRHELLHHQRQRPGDAEPDGAADQTDGRRLDQELQQDGPPLGADGFADADLARPLGHRDEHDVHDADAADKERQAGDEQADPADDGRHLVDHLQDLLLLVDGEIIRIARRQAPDAAHDAVQFFLGILQIRDVLDLDLGSSRHRACAGRRPSICRSGMIAWLSNWPNISPCFSSTPITSKGRWPIMIFFPSGDSRGNRLVATVEPITHTGRPPSASAAERNRPSAIEMPPVSRSWSVEPMIWTPLALRFSYLISR